MSPTKKHFTKAPTTEPTSAGSLTLPLVRSCLVCRVPPPGKPTWSSNSVLTWTGATLSSSFRLRRPSSARTCWTLPRTLWRCKGTLSGWCQSARRFPQLFRLLDDIEFWSLTCHIDPQKVSISTTEIWNKWCLSATLKWNFCPTMRCINFELFILENSLRNYFQHSLSLFTLHVLFS